jgi:signal transduction histidine kinase
VFINVLGNAIDAIDKQYRETQGRSQAPTLWIETSLEPGDRVAIRIRDNGSGIPPEAAERLFEPFYTTKPIGKGTGLGLSISYHIVVETHGGELKCTQTSPEGSEFAISIPLQPPRTRS